MKATVTKFDRYERNGDSEATVEVDGKCVGFIKGFSSNVGSFLRPRYTIVSYDVDVEVDGKNVERSFATRGEATKFARSLFA